MQIEAVTFSRGIYYVTAGGQIEIRLYSWRATAIFDYAISNGLLTLKSTKGTQVYKHIAESTEKAMAKESAVSLRHDSDGLAVQERSATE